MDYPAGDFLIRIKNGYLARQETVQMPYSRLVLNIAKLLKENKLINDFSVDKKTKKIIVNLLYHRKAPAFVEVKIFSKPGRRYYVAADQLPYPKGKGIIIISTSKGLMTTAEARKQNFGGEIIAQLIE